jgi:hypothetical protein
MSEKTITEKKEEPFNSKAKPEKIDYEKEFNDLLDMVSDLGLQMQNVVRNTKLRLKGQPPT